MGTTSQKLTYLNDTKTQLKGMINYGLDTGEKITSETTFRNYVKSLFDAFIKTMTYPDVLYNNLPKVTGEGTSLSLNNTVYAPMRVELSPSALEQETTTGKNMLNPIGETSSKGGVTLTNNGDGTFTANGTTSIAVDFSLTNLTTSPITLEANKPYTQTLDIISGTFGGSIVPAFKNSGGTVTYNYFNCNASSRIDTKTPTENMIAHTYNLYLGAGISMTNCTFKVQLEQNSTSTDYEEYTGGQPSPSPDYPQQIHTVSGDNTITISNSDNTQSATYPLSLGDLEYCKIGDYEDLFFKNVVGSEYYDSTLQVGKWYLKKNVGGTNLGSLNYNYNSSYGFNSSDISSLPVKPANNNTVANIICDCYIKATANQCYNITTPAISSGISINLSGAIVIRETNYNDATTFKTAMNGKYLYYPLATPTYTLLSDTLQAQLEAIWKANSYEDQTNVSQTNNDLPFVIKLSAIRDLSGIFEEI